MKVAVSGGGVRSFLLRALQVAALCAIVLSCASGTSSLADVLQPLGSRVALDAPPGFAIGQGFTGLLKSGGSSFIVADAPASAYSDLKRKFSEPTLLPTINFNAATELKLDRSGEHYAIVGNAVLDGVPYTRFLLLTHDETTTALVTASIPDREFESGAVKREDILRALASVTLRVRTPPELEFAFGYIATFQFANQAPGGGVTYLIPGRHWEEEKDGLEPMLHVSKVAWHMTSEKQKQEFAVELLKKPFFQTEIKIKNVQSVRIDGMPGWAFDVDYTFTNKKGVKEPANIYAVLLDAGASYVWLKGTTPRREADMLLPEYRKIFQSFTLKR